MAKQQWTAEKAELHAAAEETLAVARQEVSNTKSNLAVMSSSREALEKQLGETKVELTTKTTAAEAASNRVAELTECLRGEEARIVELREQSKRMEERHNIAVAELHAQITEKTDAIDGMATAAVLWSLEATHS
jgi:chromosome segregation ATPase